MNKTVFIFQNQTIILKEFLTFTVKHFHIYRRRGLLMVLNLVTPGEFSSLFFVNFPSKVLQIKELQFRVGF